MVTKIDHAYSFRRYRPVVVDDGSGDLAVLEQVDQLLVDAAVLYQERRYLDAIAKYQDVRTLLWSQLYPGTDLDEATAAAVDLTVSIVSLGSEWLNVLPIEQPQKGVRPRVDPPSDGFVELGLSSGTVGAAGTAAAADLAAAAALSVRGNAAAAAFFESRAEQTAPALTTEIQSGASISAGGAVAPGPPPPPSPPVAPPAVRVALNRPVVARAVAALAKQPAPSVLSEATHPVIPFSLTVDKRAYAFEIAGVRQTIEWNAGDAADPHAVIGQVYDAHRIAADLPDILLEPRRPSDAAIALAHSWYYETPLGLAECYHAEGDWTNAETWYLKAANYAYLNTAIEGPYVWSRLATLYLDWGNSLFRDDRAVDATTQYEKVVLSGGTQPGSALYTIPGLSVGAAEGADVIVNLQNPLAISARPTIASVVLDVWAQLKKIGAALDFWGQVPQNVPIWTFDYLQSVATTFCQLAVGAERDAVTYWDRADSGQLTRLQLSQNVALTKSEADAAARQVDAAQAELGAFQAAQATALQRAGDAQQNVNDYKNLSAEWTMHQALAAQLGGGNDGDATELNNLADQMVHKSYDLSGDRGTLVGAEQLSAARVQAEYDIDSMQREANELGLAAQQSAQEVAAATARVAAAQAAAAAAQVRIDSAQQLVDAFDQQRFTPDVWKQLGDKMDALATRYLDMAIDVAKRMQRAYNFENDVERDVIKSDYTAQSVSGYLAADCLMADVQAFTYDLVTSTTAKPQPIKQTISLASRFPYLFETQLRASGRMQFQTALDDFDTAYPGTYAGRIEHVQVSVDGIVPPSGISGSLTNDGISVYRVPQAQAAVLGSNTKTRVQPTETQIVSDYEVSADALLVDAEPRMRRVFEGSGVASSWTLDLPMDTNDLDYNALIDVRLTFTYQARYDPALRDAVHTELQSRPNVNVRQRPIPLRWLFADTFFAFYASGDLSFSLDRTFFAATELDPVLTGLSLVTITTPKAKAAGIVMKVTGPNGHVAQVTTAPDGTVDSAALAALASGSALGDYQVAIAATDNLAWVSNGALDLSAIDNIALVAEYSFTRRG